MNDMSLRHNTLCVLALFFGIFSHGQASALSTDSTIQDRSADNCEFYVNQLSLESFQYNWNQERWLRTSAMVSVDHPSSGITRGGLYLAYEENGEIHQTMIADSPRSHELADGRVELQYEFQISATRLNTTTRKTERINRRILEFAYFVEAHDVNGQTTRYWISNNSRNFRLEQDFEPYARREMNTANSRKVELESLDSPIFSEKRKCQN